MSSDTITPSSLSVGSFDPARVVADLRALADRTGGPEGSRRLCWTPEWVAARTLLREHLATLPVEVEVDEAGNLWAYLRGESPDTLVVGSHLDSVPKGGWLDGALGVMAGLELLRSLPFICTDDAACNDTCNSTYASTCEFTYASD
ncbi:MAG: M28 family peptidase, partial [Actinomycetota bacterium]